MDIRGGRDRRLTRGPRGPRGPRRPQLTEEQQRGQRVAVDVSVEGSTTSVFTVGSPCRPLQPQHDRTPRLPPPQQQDSTPRLPPPPQDRITPRLPTPPSPSPLPPLPPSPQERASGSPLQHTPECAREPGDGADDCGEAGGSGVTDETELLSKLRCPSESAEVVAEREKRRQRRRCPDYPGLALSSSVFSTETGMKFSIIRNELHNVLKPQLRRVSRCGRCGGGSRGGRLTLFMA